MRIDRLCIALACLALTLAPGAARCQEEETPRAGFGEELIVTEVLLDVLVTDERGNVILGLGPEDFVVKEAGDSVDLNSATFYSNRRFVDSADVGQRLGISSDEVPVDRYFILFFHDQRGLYPQLQTFHLNAVNRAQKWVYNELLPNDYVAVVSYGVKLQLHQDFTTDNKKITAALERVAKGKNEGGNWPSRLEGHTGPSLGKNLPQGEQLKHATKREIYAGLRVLADAAGYIKGRKNLLMFSVGFGNVNDLDTTYTLDERYYPEMMEMLNDNNVAVYSISMVRELENEDRFFDVLANSMSILSDDTGGRYFINFTDFLQPLQQAVEDNSGYYLLSYTARHPASEKGYRKVIVETTNPTFQVRARQGYLIDSGDGAG
jgi:VWFA-related protein